MTLERRLTNQQHAVAANQGDRAAISKRNGFEEILEVMRRDGADYQTQKLAVRTDELAREKKCPRASDTIERRLAHEHRQLPVGLQRLEIIAIGDVNFGNRPEARKV